MQGLVRRSPFRDKTTFADCCSCLDLLLGAEIGVVAALALAAVVCLDGERCVALSANQLFSFVCASEGSKGGLDLDAAHATTAESEHEVEG